MSDFFDKCSDTFRSFFVYGKEQESRKQYYVITVKKNFTFLREFDSRNTLFEISRNVIRKAQENHALIAF